VADTEEVRAWIYEALRQDISERQRNSGKPALGLIDIEWAIKGKLQGIGEMRAEPHGHHDELANNYKDQIREIIWGLVIQGIIVPGASTQHASLPLMQVTDWGRRCLEAGEYLPHDAGQYISRLRNRTPHADKDILLYLEDGLSALRSGAYLASAVMTGVACERTLLLLRDSVQNAISSPQSQTRFATKTKGQLIKRVFDEIWKRLDPVHDKLANDLGKEDIRAELSTSFDLIRKTRNDAGHPTGRHITREEAYNLLLLFPQYCESTYNVMKWLRLNSLP